MSDEPGGSFSERLRAAQARQAANQPPPPAESAGPSPMGIGVRVGVELVAALAVSVAIGWGLDSWLGTRPWMMALFVLLGGAAGVANVWRLLMPGARKSPAP